MENSPSTFISGLFVALTLLLLILMLIGFYKSLSALAQYKAKAKKYTGVATAVLILWLLFQLVASVNHVFEQWNALPPRLLIVLLPPLIATLLFARSKKVASLLQMIPQQSIIYVQSFRIMMEIILWALFMENIIPKQMTFEGFNVDILVGITAIVIGYVAMSHKISNRWIIVWNVAGLCILANIVIIAILSTPLPFRTFMNEPANTIIAQFPFVWLPGFVVPVAYFLHVCSIKKAWNEIKNPSTEKSHYSLT
jgi:hypothetical protein